MLSLVTGEADGHVDGVHPAGNKAVELLPPMWLARRRYGSRSEPAYRQRKGEHRPYPPPARQRPPVTVVAPEQLVGALPGQDDLHALIARQAAHGMQRHADRIRERLVLVMH